MSNTIEAVKERPILFSAPMARAILDGRKTQTRRAIKNLPEGIEVISNVPGHDAPDEWHVISSYAPRYAMKCPLGKPGDRLWGRETWAAFTEPHPEYGDCDEIEGPIDGAYLEHHSRPCLVFNADGKSSPEKWRPSIFMPRWASRITLEITKVRVERLQDISPEDAMAEGIGHLYGWDKPDIPIDAEARYFELWDSISGKGAAALNPWVWVYDFKVLPSESKAPAATTTAGES